MMGGALIMAHPSLEISRQLTAAGGVKLTFSSLKIYRQLMVEGVRGDIFFSGVVTDETVTLL